MIAALGLSGAEIALLALICFGAGLVRGFSGFALSALVMATAVAILPPVELIPMLWFLEMSASLMMVRGGLQDAERKTTSLLVAGTWIGWPIGLALTVSLPVDASKTIALSAIVVLALSQIAGVRIAFLATTAGTIITGFVAGIASGLAHIGGMVVALYVLARGASARSMRGTLVVYLFISALGSFVVQLFFGVMDMSGAARGLSMAVPTIIGVWAGKKFFTPKWEPYYRPFCLWLLIALAVFSLLKHLI